MKTKIFLSILVLSPFYVHSSGAGSLQQEFKSAREDFTSKAEQLRSVKNAEEAKRLLHESLKYFAEMRNLIPTHEYVSLGTYSLINRLKELDTKFNNKIKDVYQSKHMPTLVIQAIEEYKKIADTDPEKAAQLLEDIHDIYTWKNMNANSQGQIRSHLGVASLDDWYKKQKKALEKK